MAEPPETFSFPEYRSPSPPEVHLPGPQLRRQAVEIEEVDDADDSPSETRYQVPYPGRVADVLGKGQMKFEQWHEDQASRGENEWAPFENQEEWDLAQWLM